MQNAFVAQMIQKHQVSKDYIKIFFPPIEIGRLIHFELDAASHNQKRSHVAFQWVTKMLLKTSAFVIKMFQKHRILEYFKKIFLLPIEMRRQNRNELDAVSPHEKRFDVPFQWVTKIFLKTRNFCGPNVPKTSSFEKTLKKAFCYPLKQGVKFTSS